MKIQLLFFCVLPLFLSCTKTEEQAVEPEEFLKDHATFPVGAAIDYGLLKDNSQYRNVLRREHTSITAENAMKWNSTHPQQDVYNFKDADYIVEFAQSQGQRIHGHTLLWYQFQNISWVKNFQGDSAAWEQLLKNHIQTLVGHFKGKVSSWDVVNEAFRDDDGSLRVLDKDPGTFDDGCLFARKVGRDYIARSFRYAHEADPDALLFYNEYGQEWSSKKIQSILTMVADFKNRGVPIHGLGIQMHIDINTLNTGIENAIRQLAATGLKIHISELDIRVNPNNSSTFAYTDALQSAQAEKFKFVVKTYRSLVPASQQFGITTWNVSDNDSWIISYLKKIDYPLLFNSSYQKKKSYAGFLQGLKE